MAVVEIFKEALKQRVGADRYRMWFTSGVSFELRSGRRSADDVPASPIADEPTSDNARDGALLDSADEFVIGEQAISESLISTGGHVPGDSPVTSGVMIVNVRAAFAAERLEAHFMRELRGAAMQACGQATDVEIVVGEVQASSEPTASVPAATAAQSSQPSARRPAARQPVAGRPENAGSVGTSSAGTSSAGKRARGNSAPRERNDRASRKPGQSNSLASLLSGSAAAAPSKSRSRGGRPAAAPVAGGTTGGFSTAKSAGAAALPGPVNLPAADPATTNHDARRPPAGDASPAVMPPQEMASHSGMTMSSFVAGSSNQLAYTAATMVCQTPGVASPLFVFGPSGTGKTHLLRAIAEQLRRRHRMRRVIYLSSEQFTNDFISSVGSSGLPAFRRRYRDVDALLVDDVQFLGAKKATIREMLYTIETLTASGKSLIFAANQSPTEISGLTSELAGRMAAGLVCPVQALDAQTRAVLLREAAEQRCLLPWTDEMVAEISAMLTGDGRVISGVVNLVGTLQRMYRRMPTLAEISQFGGDLIRAQAPVVSLTTIERAVCETFGLDDRTLRTAAQTRTVTEPRMLAMYLSRQMTSSAFSEIAKHYGGKSHSTAIAANQKVEKWLSTGKSLGRGPRAMSARQAIDRIESMLRAG